MAKQTLTITIEFDDVFALLDFQEPRYDEKLTQLADEYVRAASGGRGRVRIESRHLRPSEEIMAQLDAERLGIPIRKDGTYDEERYRKAVFERARRYHAQEAAEREQRLEQQRQDDLALAREALEMAHELGPEGDVD